MQPQTQKPYQYQNRRCTSAVSRSSKVSLGRAHVGKTEFGEGIWLVGAVAKPSEVKEEQCERGEWRSQTGCLLVCLFFSGWKHVKLCEYRNQMCGYVYMDKFQNPIPTTEYDIRCESFYLLGLMQCYSSKGPKGLHCLSAEVKHPNANGKPW